ncbi:DUF6443 domain-containing protein [Paraflavitalea soli]|uniref:DUF6443 domain-containing protein n=1 Tax=Paraflavitalea soli TaxID=2315862 RepID=UPI0013C47399|nr:DUF6443 domain-containing protein [Paraflavitalea soli]
MNYVRTWSAGYSVNSSATLKQGTLLQVKQSTQYFDGLGRIFQTVSKQGAMATVTSPNGTFEDIAAAVDLVQPVLYDALGREQYKFVAFAANNAGGNVSVADGELKLTPYAQHQLFMDGYFSSQNEANYYSKSIFEITPLSRAMEQFAPGKSWAGTASQLNANDRHSQKFKYWSNTAADAVRIWDITDGTAANPLSSVYATTTAYLPGTLFKTVSEDEHGKQVIEFKDKEGQVILRKIQLTAAADDGTGSGYLGWLCTYYLYDDLNHLRCVIQPEGVNALYNAGWDFSQVAPTGGGGGAILLEEQCFRYEFDFRDRIVVKKVPGAFPAYMVYDNRDRLVLTQDGNLAAQATPQWRYTQYDNFNRAVATGIWTTNIPLATHISAANGVPTSLQDNYPAANAAGLEELTRTFYDDYGFLSNTAYAGHGLPITASTAYANAYLEPVSNTTWPYAQSVAINNNVKSMVTGGRVRALGTNTWLYSANYYDGKGRVILVQQKNLTGGTDNKTTQYSFSGAPFLEVQQQEVVGGSGTETTVTVTKFTYDALGRMVKTEKKVSNSSVAASMPAFKTVSKIFYNTLGQVKEKAIGTKPGNSSLPLENLHYEYNVRGWLLGINRAFTSPAVDAVPGTSSWFGFDLGYDKLANASGRSYTAVQYNGNLEGMIWRSVGDGVSRKYDFGYDAANRLLRGVFEQRNADGNWNNSQVNYGMMMGDDGFDVASAYDLNGNIKRMQQWGLKAGANAQVDDLRYTYKQNGKSNQLQNVIDLANDAGTMLGDFRTASTHPQYTAKLNPSTQANTIADYAYDANGNLITDLNKAIGTQIPSPGNGGAITYNHLNLPWVITVAGKGTITFAYDGLGRKLKKTVAEGANITTTWYIGSDVYEQKNSGPLVLQFETHEDGRIRNATLNGGTGLVYDYFLKDHLGNVRMVLTEEQKVLRYPASTLEGSTTIGINSLINTEKNYFTIDESKIKHEINIPDWGNAIDNVYYNHNGNPPANDNYPQGVTPASTIESVNLYELNGASNRTGLQFMIKVMAGDKIDIFGRSYYKNTATINNSNSTLLDVATILGGMLQVPGSAVAAKGVTGTQLAAINNGTIPSSFIRGNNNETTTVPKAYINYLFFDDQFKYVGGDFSRVGTSDIVKDHWTVDQANLKGVMVPKNGYLFVYVSNESNVNVYFDNIQVIRTPGPLLEETHYYPFGLAMSGISSRATNGIAGNKIKFGGKELQSEEFSDGSGLELYDFDFRTLDPQIGRFHGIDPLSDLDRRWTPYRYAYNNPLRYIDPDGLWEIEIGEREIMKKGKGTGKFEKYIQFVAEKGDDISTLAEQTGLSKEKLEKGLQGVEIKEGTKLDKLGVRAADNIISEGNYYLNNQGRAWNSNCFGTALSLSKDGRINFDIDNSRTGTIGNPQDADQKLQENFKQTEKPTFGDVIRYAFADGYKGRDDFGHGLPDKGNEAGGTQHYAVFLLKTKSGDVYVFSKNGAGEKGPWVVTKDSSFTSSYGERTPIGTGSPYYTTK